MGWTPPPTLPGGVDERSSENGDKKGCVTVSPRSYIPGGLLGKVVVPRSRARSRSVVPSMLYPRGASGRGSSRAAPRPTK